MARYRSFEEHRKPTDGTPKRILALDGGGLRGMMTVQVLRKIEGILRKRFKDDRMVLSSYFDLIAGTSTGAIIAGGLSLGMTVDEIEKCYQELGEQVFMKSFWRRGITRDSYDSEAVAKALRGVYGTKPLSRKDFKTGLLVVAKRLDTGSTWVLTNNPESIFFNLDPNDPEVIPNGEYPLWQVVRASTAAPTFFAPEEISIHSKASAERKNTVGLFVDGGCSPHNNPSLQALMAATMDGYRYGWPAGEKNLLVVSVGTGKANPEVDTSSKFTGLAAAQGLLALKNLMEDCGDLVETMMQWLSTSPTARAIDLEMGKCQPALGGGAMISYQRYNAMFTAEWFQKELGKKVKSDYLETMQEMDKPENLKALADLGKAVADKQVKAEHFPPEFDVGVVLP